MDETEMIRIYDIDYNTGGYNETTISFVFIRK